MTGQLQQTKKNLRQHILSLRSQISEDLRNKANQLISFRLQAMWQYRQAQTILFYLDFRGEVATDAIINKAWEMGKIVCVPLTIPKTRTINIYAIKGWDDLQPGNYGILEPIPERCNLIDYKDLNLVITPGVAFDEDCNRLGYGGGYYDRLASKLGSTCPRIALAYELQIVEQVPFGIYDIPVDVVITEKRIIRRGNRI